MVGLELRDVDAVAVVVDERGAVSSRVVAAGADLAAAGVAALGKLPVSAIGLPSVAAMNPESPSTAAAMKALAAKFDGSLGQAAPVASGTAAAAAEAWIGAARDRRNVVYLGVADHATAGILHDGRAMTGVHGRAPAIAWLALNPVEREDYRKTGCLEAEVAASGIVRRLVWRIKAGDRSRIQDAVGDDLAAIALDHVLDAARAGDGVSISVMRDTAKYLGMAAANLVAVADPEVLVLGGIMASAADLLLEPVRTEIGRRLPPAMMQALTIEPAALGAEAAAIGATRLVAIGLA
jgi:glucokinase